MTALTSSAPSGRRGPAIPRMGAGEQQSLLRQRTNLAIWIARLQMTELKDPKAAAATLAEAVDLLKRKNAEVDYVCPECEGEAVFPPR